MAATAAAPPAPGDIIPLALTMRLSQVQVGKWRQQRAELVALAPAKNDATQPSRSSAIRATDNAAAEERLLHWDALPLALHKEWLESMWANVSSPQPQLFLIYLIEDGDITLSATVAGDEAAGYGEVDATVLSTPMPEWLLQQVRAFVGAYYRPEKKRVRKRQ